MSKSFYVLKHIKSELVNCCPDEYQNKEYINFFSTLEAINSYIEKYKIPLLSIVSIGELDSTDLDFIEDGQEIDDVINYSSSKNLKKLLKEDLLRKKDEKQKEIHNENEVETIYCKKCKKEVEGIYEAIIGDYICKCPYCGEVLDSLKREMDKMWRVENEIKR